MGKHKPFRLMLGSKIIASFNTSDELEAAYDETYNNPPEGMNENRLSKVTMPSAFNSQPVDIFSPEFEAATKKTVD